MFYLLLSLAQLALTPLIVLGIARYKRVSQVFAFLLIAAITYNIFAHIILEHLDSFGWGALAAAGFGLILFSYGDHFFFVENSRKSSWFFLILLQIFLFLHAMTDGAALINVHDAGLGNHMHPEKLSQSVLLHRLMFEAFIWKYFYERHGHRAALLVLLNIAVGTVIGFFTSQAVFSHMPAYFDLFEAFMGGALFHLVYDYLKENVLRIRHRHG
ncbi:MAG: hypothetical protein EOP07_02970 [Proteobacteria bacterium]|nr:MAG: hypothetical protein EOP07_02970 [Pseudomonadota bacterium]